ncbi:MAG TPA: hypothetical protein VFH50_12630 [Acidimicrobiales bacterium]|nr:hypothetical protein [Acidimicrobiales bacterium]
MPWDTKRRSDQRSEESGDGARRTDRSGTGVQATILRLQAAAGNRAVGGSLTDLGVESRERVQRSRSFWQGLTASPPAAKRLTEVDRQAPPELVTALPDVVPEQRNEASPPAYSEPEPELAQGQEDFERALAYSEPVQVPADEQQEPGRPPVAYSELPPAGEQLERGTQPVAYSEPERPPVAQPPVAYADPGQLRRQEEPPARVPVAYADPGLLQGQGVGGASPGPGGPGRPSEGPGPGRRGWSRIREIVSTVRGQSPTRVLPGREGPVKLLNVDSPFVKGMPETVENLKPRRRGDWANWNNYWLEAIDPKHRPGFVLAKRWEEWARSGDSGSFWDWLGDRDIDPASDDERSMDGKNVQYGLSESERSRFMVLAKEGQLYRDGAPMDTAANETVASGSGWAIFVLSTAGVFYAESHKQGEFHHSTFLAGGAVRAAGELQVGGGRLVKITGKSGHYRPTSEHLRYAVGQLEKRGVDLSATQVGDFQKNPDGTPKKDADDKLIFSWYRAADYLEHGPAAAPIPDVTEPEPPGPHAPDESRQPIAASGPAASLSPDRRLELLQQARDAGWHLEPGRETWTDGTQAYVPEEQVLEAMLSSGSHDEEEGNDAPALEIEPAERERLLQRAMASGWRREPGRETWTDGAEAYVLESDVLERMQNG